MYMTLMPTVPHYGFRLCKPSKKDESTLLLITPEELDELIGHALKCDLPKHFDFQSLESLRSLFLSGGPIDGKLAYFIFDAAFELHGMIKPSTRFFETALFNSNGFYRDLGWKIQ